MRAILRVMGAAGLFVSGAMLALADGIKRQPGGRRRPGGCLCSRQATQLILRRTRSPPRPSCSARVPAGGASVISTGQVADQLELGSSWEMRESER